jgi:hypothetical protein
MLTRLRKAIKLFGSFFYQRINRYVTGTNVRFGANNLNGLLLRVSPHARTGKERKKSVHGAIEIQTSGN